MNINTQHRQRFCCAFMFPHVIRVYTQEERHAILKLDRILAELPPDRWLSPNASRA